MGSDVEIRESLHNIKLHAWMSSPKSKCRERERTEDRTVGYVYISCETMAKKYWVNTLIRARRAMRDEHKPGRFTFFSQQKYF